MGTTSKQTPSGGYHLTTASNALKRHTLNKPHLVFNRLAHASVQRPSSARLRPGASPAPPATPPRSRWDDEQLQIFAEESEEELLEDLDEDGVGPWGSVSGGATSAVGEAGGNGARAVANAGSAKQATRSKSNTTSRPKSNNARGRSGKKWYSCGPPGTAPVPYLSLFQHGSDTILGSCANSTESACRVNGRNGQTGRERPWFLTCATWSKEP